MIFGLQNSLKVYMGRTEALADKSLIAKKQADEDDFRKKVAANREWEKEYGSAWDTIAKAEEQEKPLSGLRFSPDGQPALSIALSVGPVRHRDQEARWRAACAISRCKFAVTEVSAAFAGDDFEGGG